MATSYSQSASMATDYRMSLEAEYDEIEFYLKQAQEEIGQALSNLSPHQQEALLAASPKKSKSPKCEAANEKNISVPHQVNMDIKYQDKEINQGYHSLEHPRKKTKLPEYQRQRSEGATVKAASTVDFHSIFSLTEPLTEEAFLTISESEPNLQISGDHVKQQKTSSPYSSRPSRPLTLAPHVRLPQCCNFKNRDWRFYVSGNFNTNLIPDNAVYVDPLDSLIGEKSRSLSSGLDSQDKSTGYYASQLKTSRNNFGISSPSLGYDQKKIVESKDSDGKKVYTFSVSSTIDAPKASGTYQSLSSSTSDGSSTKFPLEISKRSSEDEPELVLRGFHSHEDCSKVYELKHCNISESLDYVDNFKNEGSSSASDSVQYTSTRLIISADVPGNAGNMELATSTKPVHKDAPVHPVNSSSKSLDEEVLFVPQKGITSLPSEVVPLSEPKPGSNIKLNGISSPKRTMREKRLRVRSDPTRMGIKVKECNGELQPKEGYKVASIQTESTFGVLSPTTCHRFIEDSEALDLASRSPEKEYHAIENGISSLSHHDKDGDLKKSKQPTDRSRSQSADRVESRHKRWFRPRGKSASPDRRGGSPCKSEVGRTSRVSRSTQTHRSIIKCGTNNILAMGASSQNSHPVKTKANMIHVKLDDILNNEAVWNDTEGKLDGTLRKEVNQEFGSDMISSKKLKPKPRTADVKVIPLAPLNKQLQDYCEGCQKSNQEIAESDLVIENTKKSKKSKQSKMATSVSTKAKISESEVCELCKDTTNKSNAGHTVVYFPTREARRIQVRPQMPVIVEDVQKSEDEISESASSTSNSLRRTPQYYGSLKTEKSNKMTDFISPLSKSANDVNEKTKVNKADKEDSKKAKTLLDTMHRKYYPSQYKIQQSKAKSAEALSSMQIVNGEVYKCSTVPYCKSSPFLSEQKVRVTAKATGQEIQSSVGGNYGSGSDSRTSSPPYSSSGSSASPKTPHLTLDTNSVGSKPASNPSSPEETKELDFAKFTFDCCQDVTAECDIKSIQMLMKSEKECAEIEAIEACKWLRAAGFPQYAQMYEDHLFPVDVSAVEKDHDFLDSDSLQSLFRRLNTLNKCATMKIEAPPRKALDDSDDEDPCALSDKWKYQRSSRRWSRKDLDINLSLGAEDSVTTDKSGIRSCSSHDSVITDNDESLASQQEDSPTAPCRSPYSRPAELYFVDLPGSGQPSPNSAHNNSLTSGHISDSDNSNAGSVPMSPTVLKRSASEKFKSAKNTFFKRMESLKSKRSSVRGRHPKMGSSGRIEIGSPVLVETKSIQERMDRLGCKEISPSVETSPNLSTSSRNTNGSCNGPLDNSHDNDSVFLDHAVVDQKSEDPVILPKASTNKRRIYSESEVETRTIAYSHDDHADMATSPVSNGYLDVGNGSQFNQRTGSFSLGIRPGEPLINPSQSLNDHSNDSHNGSPTEESNNNIEKDIKLRQRGSTSSDRRSMYDNVPLDPDSEAVRELDLIVKNLMQDISELNATWGMSQSGSTVDSIPLDLTLDEALQDFSGSDRDNTLTRKSHKTQEINDNIPTFSLDGSTHATSHSSSSSTISHSNSAVTSTQAQNTPFDLMEVLAQLNISITPDNDTNVSNDYTQLRLSATDVDINSCEDHDSSHFHVTSHDDTLDNILKSLETHYGAQKLSSVSEENKSTSHSGSTNRDTNANPMGNTTLKAANLAVEEDFEPDPDSRSASLSNAELSDMEITPGSREEDISEAPGDHADTRERRDSGVGSSLTREPSDRRRYRIRWHSFVKSHRPSFNSRDLQINSMSAGQLKLLRKFSLLKVTALMEKYSLNRSGWNWVMPMNKLMRRFKGPQDYKDRNVFGVPLMVTLQRSGQPLPQCMLHAMRCLRKKAHDAIGIFRKPGVRSRIQKLREEIEAGPESVSFESLQAYDVADLLKQYFRELPECLLTNKLSESFINIFTHVPVEQRLEALYAAVMLLPDENREVLQSLLLFLSDMADYAKQNQMNASNLAVCFAPSLFHLCGSRQMSNASPKRNRKKDTVPDQRELQQQKAAHECLTEMIVHSKKIFMVPGETLRMCHFSYLDQCTPVGLEELGRRRLVNSDSDTGDYMAYLESCIQGLLKEARDRFKNWVSVSSHNDVDMAYKKIDDGYTLRLWKCAVEVEAPPYEVLTRVYRERQMWDEDLLQWRIAETLDSNTEVFQYVINSMAPHPTRDYCELRHWRTDLQKGACVLVSTSIEHDDAPLIGGVRGVVLASRYLIEPCGSGKSRLTHISRVDIRGHTPDWYNKVYGHLCANLMCRIKASFMQPAEGPETNV